MITTAASWFFERPTHIGHIISIVISNVYNINVGDTLFYENRRDWLFEVQQIEESTLATHFNLIYLRVINNEGSRPFSCTNFRIGARFITQHDTGG